ncbi:hypothetical protein [Streptomyces sp. NPDC056069]|uniref:hypothetical protein n=1 Tax=Streptomyces sp. NPDC056069 TaxID=3345702 RepID=UPI0035DD213C
MDRTAGVAEGLGSPLAVFPGDRAVFPGDRGGFLGDRGGFLGGEFGRHGAPEAFAKALRAALEA